MQNIRVGVKAVALVLLASLVLTSSSWAQDNSSSSANYELTEPQFGAGSELDICSGAYCAQATIGQLGPDSESVPSSASFGVIPENSDPLLEVIVDPGESNLGTLSATKTATKTMIVRVRSYMSDGYTLQVTGTPPMYDGHVLGTPSSPTASTPGTEQFAINVVANTTPDIGANPAHIPAEIFSFGQVMPDYATADLFKYQSGDTVASSEVESGRTDYTISMIVNISSATPAGHYSGDYSAIVVPRF